jgi:hypothetical protein
MALIGNLNAKDKYNSYRETIKNAYFKIESVTLDTQKEKARVQVRGFLSEYARHNQGIGIFKRVFYVPLDYYGEVLCLKDELIKRSYDYISNLPEFKAAKPHEKPYTGTIDITQEVVQEQTKELEDLIAELKDH